MMSLCSDRDGSVLTGKYPRRDEGQATLEAALVLPVFMLLLALLVQPACILYTRAVMQSAAAETCRVLTTATSAPTSSAFAEYTLRRLSAIPNINIFHTGGSQGWDLEFEGSLSSHSVRVSISGSVEPLPFLGIVPALMGTLDENGNIILHVEVTHITRPSWLEGGYSDWVSVW